MPLLDDLPPPPEAGHGDLLNSLPPPPEVAANDAVETLTRVRLRRQGVIPPSPNGPDDPADFGFDSREQAAAYRGAGLHENMSPEEIQARVSGQDTRPTLGPISRPVAGFAEGTARLFGEPGVAESIAQNVQDRFQPPGAIGRGGQSLGAIAPVLLGSIAAMRGAGNPAIASAGFGPRATDLAQRGAMAALFSGETLREDIEANPAGAFNSPGHTVARAGIQGLTQMVAPGTAQALATGTLRTGLANVADEVGGNVIQGVLGATGSQYITESQQAQEAGHPLEHDARLGASVSGAGLEAILPAVALTVGGHTMQATTGLVDAMQGRDPLSVQLERQQAQQAIRALDPAAAQERMIPGRPGTEPTAPEGPGPRQITPLDLVPRPPPEGTDLTLEAQKLAEAETVAPDEGLVPPPPRPVTDEVAPPDPGRQVMPFSDPIEPQLAEATMREQALVERRKADEAAAQADVAAERPAQAEEQGALATERSAQTAPIQARLEAAKTALETAERDAPEAVGRPIEEKIQELGGLKPPSKARGGGEYDPLAEIPASKRVWGRKVPDAMADILYREGFITEPNPDVMVQELMAEENAHQAAMEGRRIVREARAEHRAAETEARKVGLLKSEPKAEPGDQAPVRGSLTPPKLSPEQAAGVRRRARPEDTAEELARLTPERRLARFKAIPAAEQARVRPLVAAAVKRLRASPEVEAARVAAEQRAAQIATEETPPVETALPPPPRPAPLNKGIPHDRESRQPLPRQRQGGQNDVGVARESRGSAEAAPGNRDLEAPPGARSNAAPEVTEPLTVERLQSQMADAYARTGLPPERQAAVVDAEITLIRAAANAAGENADEFVRKRLVGIEGGKRPVEPSLNQKAKALAAQEDTLGQPDKLARGHHGNITFFDDGRALIRILESANESTAGHELFHLFRRYLKPADLAIAERAIGVKNGNWTRANEEAFSRLGERWRAKGEPPTNALAGVFAKFKQWMSDVYHGISGSAIDVKLSPAMEKVFANILTEGKGLQGEYRASGREGRTVEAPAKVDTPKAAAPKPVEELPKGPLVNPRPDLATQATDLAQRTAEEQARGQGDQTVVTKEENRAAATKRLDADFEGEVKKLIARHGDVMNKVEDEMARQAATKLYAAGRTKEFAALTQAHAMARTEVARVMVGGVDQLLTPEGRLAEARAMASLPRDATAKHIDFIRNQIAKASKRADELAQSDPAENKRLAARVRRLRVTLDNLEVVHLKQFTRTKDRLKELGFDLDEANPEWASTPEKYEDFLAALKSTQGGLPNVIRELMTSGLHMSGAVFGKKIVTDAVSMTAQVVRSHLEALTGELVHAATGREDVRRVQDLAAAWAALPAAAKLAGQSFVHAYSKEVMLPILRQGGVNELHAYPAIGGKLGKGIRHLSLMSTVRAIDGFSRALVARTEVASVASRIGREQGLHGADLAEHIATEVATPTSDAWREARDVAMRTTFTEKPMAPIRAINRLKFENPKTVGGKAAKAAASILYPFSNIPSNLVKQGVSDWIPAVSDLVTLGNWYKVHHDVKPGEAGLTTQRVHRDIVQAGMRWAAFAGAAALAANSEITGGDDPDHPYSFRAGNLRLSYAHLGPVKQLLASAANFFHGGAGHAGSEFVRDLFGGKKTEHSRFNTRGEEVITRPLLDLVYATQEPDGMLKWLAQETAIAEPSVVKQAVNATNARKDYKTAPTTDPAAARLWAYTKQAWEVEQGKQGKEKETLGAGDMPDALWRIFSPFDLGTKKP